MFKINYNLHWRQILKFKFILLGGICVYIFLSSTTNLRYNSNNGNWTLRTFILSVIDTTDIVPVPVIGWYSNTSRNISDYLSIGGDGGANWIVPYDFCHPNTSNSSSHSILLLVIVCSAPANVQSRNAIRDTWATGAESDVIQVVFLLGQSTENVSKNVLSESDVFGDMIIVNDFIDTYLNLTLKSVMMLHLVANYCRPDEGPKFVMKIDDDMFLNVPLLVHRLKIGFFSSTDLLLGRRIHAAKPIQDTTNKWYTPKYLYGGGYYPDYLSGTGYLLSFDVVGRLLNATWVEPVLHLEDVYMTGLCAQRAQIQLTNSNLFTFTTMINTKEMGGANGDVSATIRKRLKTIITAHGFPPEDLYIISKP